jgi:hypothetical protein
MKKCSKHYYFYFCGYPTKIHLQEPPRNSGIRFNRVSIKGLLRDTYVARRIEQNSQVAKDDNVFLFYLV